MHSVRDIAFAAGMAKAAAAAFMTPIDDVKDTVLSRARALIGDGAREDMNLDRLGEREVQFVSDCEDVFGVKLSDSQLSNLFSHGTFDALAAALTSCILHCKTAGTASKSDAQARQRRHQMYMMQRSQHLTRSKIYRMQHMQQIRRKSRAYRVKVKRKIVRPKKRVGTASGGYSFVQR
jgi:hypothetical protein